MTHLSDVDLVDLVDGLLPADRQAHVEQCSECQKRADALRETLARTSEVEVPEPSPLFWEHFSARVREGVHAASIEPAPSMFGWMTSPAIKWALSACVVAIVLAAGMASMWRAYAPTLPPQQIAQTTEPAIAAPGHAETEAVIDLSDPDQDAAWALVRTVADDASWDDSVGAGVTAAPGATELAAKTLSVQEREELVRLLEAAIKHPGA